MRRSSRSNGAVRSDAASALADLAARKASGTTRTADYEVQEEEAIYETVDEQTYAAIAAQKRKEARDFIAAPDDGMPDEDGAAMELEFEMEDEMSVVGNQKDRKRRRNPTPRAPKRHETPTKRVSSSFFNSFHAAPKAANPSDEAEDGSNAVFDGGMLDADFDKQMSATRAARKKRKLAVQRSVGNLLFDSNPEPPSDAGVNNPVEPLPVAPLPPAEPVDEYAAPPPSVTNTMPIIKPSNRPGPLANKSSNPPAAFSNPILEDSLDADAVIAAAEAAEKLRDVATPGAVKQQSAPVHIPVPAPQPQLRGPQENYALPTIPANAPLARDNSGNLIMFWTDAHELSSNGGQQLYLFGKVPVQHINSGIYASVCVHVQGMERVLYVLPRKHRVDPSGKPTSNPVKLVPDVHSEVTSILLGKNTNNKTLGSRSSSNLPSSVKAKKVIRSCPFGDSHAPREPTEYLKVKFPFAKYNKLQPESNGTTFSRVFGSKTSASEAFCLKRKLKGPSWLVISNTKLSEKTISHAKYTFSVESPMDVNISTDLTNKEEPPLSALCLSAKTVLNPKSGTHEVVMIAGVYVREVPLSGPMRDGVLEPGGPMGTRDFILLRPPDGKAVPFGFADRARSMLARGGGVDVMPNEPALLNNFLTKVLKLDPDVIIGHDIFGFGLDVLLSRMSVRRSREWSRLGRLVQRRDLTQLVKNTSNIAYFKPEAVAGRLVLDTYTHAQDQLVREKDYTLSALSQNVLAPVCGPSVIVRPSTEVSLVPKVFESTDLLCRLVTECSHEARTAGRLAAHLNVLPLTKQLTCISGNLWSHTLFGKRAERIEYLLCHEFKLIGSKNSGAAGKAGNIETKLLLPDKLNKLDRTKIAEEIERQKKLATPKPAGAGFGYGGGMDDADQEAKNNLTNQKGKSSRRKPQYSGGLVLEPKRGFYDRYVLQLDFNSLYPSIIQEFNICFTTLNLKKDMPSIMAKDENEEKDDIDITGESASTASGSGLALPLPGSGTLEGILPRVLRRLVQQRRQVKALLKEERQKSGKETLRAQQLDTRQLAIKLTANSLYGCLGFESSKFFARPLAEMVTYQGRDTLQNTVNLARDVFNAQVIYGDTDSLFVYTGLEDINLVRKLGAELKRDVNKKYRTLEIEIDAIYRKMLLLRKKKYASLKVVDPNKPDKTILEVKGLDVVRHDWCDLSHDASNHFLDQIFHGRTSNVDDAVGNILSFLTDLAQKVNNNQVSLSKYVITRSLTKRPQDYPDATTLPHVVVANRLIKEHGKRIKPNDYIKYVICVTADKKVATGNIATRAYHPDEVLASHGKLVIDTKYYLENQILPPIMRMIEPIESIEASRVAMSLGLDGRRYERRDDSPEDGNYLALGPQSAAEKFRDVDVITIKCNKCNTVNELTGMIFAPSGKAIKTTGLQCVKCLSAFPKHQLLNCVSLKLRAWKTMYYTTALQQDADDGRRRREVRDVGLGGQNALVTRKYDEAWLYKQLRYAQYLMDVETRWLEIKKEEVKDLPGSTGEKDVYELLLNKVNQVFDANAYRFVDFGHFLAPLGITS